MLEVQDTHMMILFDKLFLAYMGINGWHVSGPECNSTRQSIRSHFGVSVPHIAVQLVLHQAMAAVAVPIAPAVAAAAALLTPEQDCQDSELVQKLRCVC